MFDSILFGIFCDFLATSKMSFQKEQGQISFKKQLLQLLRSNKSIRNLHFPEYQTLNAAVFDRGVLKQGI